MEELFYRLVMSDADLFSDAFGPETGTPYRISRGIAAAFPDKAVVEVPDGFDVEEYARAGQCEAVHRRPPHAQSRAGWRRKHGLFQWMVTGLFDVRWQGAALVVAKATWPEGYRTRESWWIVADDRTIADRFVEAVCAFCNEPHEAVLAFRGSCWSKDHEIWQAIQAASFEDLVLAGDLAREIREDFTSFMSAREEYARYGVPWKRGVLFLGPPGNGKTHCLRATLKLLGVPVLYVQSLKSRYETDDANIAQVFDRAREVTPCCLVFEDLDAMITSKNRSTFLNQLDGFANASGMLTLATTNHPEALDPAIVDRPSRFDRKYHFDLPKEPERGRYIVGWRERLDSEMRITDEEVEALVRDTDGFSFAYLKELFLSAMIRWMHQRQDPTPNGGGMFPILQSQLQTLRDQMRTELAPQPRAKPDDDDDDD